MTPSGPVPLIRSYLKGTVRVGGAAWQSAVLLASSGLQAALRPQSPAELEERDLEPVLIEKPEVVVIGWAGGQTFLPTVQRRWFLERQIGLEIMELGAACRTYNLLVGDERRVVALLFPISPPALT